MENSIKINIYNIVKSLFFSNDDSIEISDFDDFIEAGLCDSLGLVKFATELEKEYKIILNDQDITRENIGSINNAYDFLLKNFK